VTEDAAEEDRDGDEARVRLRPLDDVGRARHLGGVELQELRHSPEGLFGVHDQEIEVDPLWTDAAVDDRACAIHVHRGEGNGQLTNNPSAARGERPAVERQTLPASRGAGAPGIVRGPSWPVNAVRSPLARRPGQRDAAAGVTVPKSG